jgi:hypothetical protein
LTTIGIDKIMNCKECGKFIHPLGMAGHMAMHKRKSYKSTVVKAKKVSINVRCSCGRSFIVYLPSDLAEQMHKKITFK